MGNDHTSGSRKGASSDTRSKKKCFRQNPCERRKDDDWLQSDNKMGIFTEVNFFRTYISMS